MFKYTKTTLQKIEIIFEELDYKVRYERGSFKSGYCLVENRNVAVVNRFFDTEGRINVLLEILSTFDDIDLTAFTEKTLDFYKKIMKTLDKKEGEEEDKTETSEEAVVETGKEEAAKSE